MSSIASLRKVLTSTISPFSKGNKFGLQASFVSELSPAFLVGNSNSFNRNIFVKRMSDVSIPKKKFRLYNRNRAVKTKDIKESKPDLFVEQDEEIPEGSVERFILKKSNVVIKEDAYRTVMATFNEKKSLFRKEAFYISAKRENLVTETFVTWNVGGIRACYKKGNPSSIFKDEVDYVCLQEMKCKMELLPESLKNTVVENGPYNLYLNCDKNNSAHAGVAILTRKSPQRIIMDMPPFTQHDGEGRVITAEYKKFFLVNVYAPQSGLNLRILQEKLNWENNFRRYLDRLRSNKPVIIAGDFNATASVDDFYFENKSIRFPSCTYEERSSFWQTVSSINGFDVFKTMNLGKKKPSYSFWSYQGFNRKYNRGMRLDYFIMDKYFQSTVYDCNILSKYQGSDHCPVVMALKESK